MSALVSAVWSGPYPGETGGQTLLPGDEHLVTEADLESEHWVAKGGKAKETRAQLNERALAAGVENPEGLANRQAVLDAIEAAEAGAGDTGEGGDS